MHSSTYINHYLCRWKESNLSVRLTLGASVTSCCADTQKHHLGLEGTDRALPWRGSTGGEPGLSARHHSICRGGAPQNSETFLLLLWSDFRVPVRVLVWIFSFLK